MFFSTSVVNEIAIAKAYRPNGPSSNISEATEFASIFAPRSLSWLCLILSMNLSGRRWWAKIRGLLKLNPCSSSCSPRAGRPVRPEATHQERLIAEKITLLNTLPGQCFFSPVATCSPAYPDLLRTNELPLDTDNTTERNWGQYWRKNRGVCEKAATAAPHLHIFVAH